MHKLQENDANGHTCWMRASRWNERCEASTSPQQPQFARRTTAHWRATSCQRRLTGDGHTRPTLGPHRRVYCFLLERSWAALTPIARDARAASAASRALDSATQVCAFRIDSEGGAGCADAQGAQPLRRCRRKATPPPLSSFQASLMMFVHCRCLFALVVRCNLSCAFVKGLFVWGKRCDVHCFADGVSLLR